MIDSFEGAYRFLSNFYPSPIVYEGIEYTTIENAFQAAKSLDKDIRLTFVNLTPGQAKRHGRTIELRADWQEVKLSVMHDLFKLKFNSPELRTKLLETGDAVLVEGNGWDDTFWGVCNVFGENNLGKLLMQVR